MTKQLTILTKELTEEEVKSLQLTLGYPQDLSKKHSKPIDFLTNITEWHEYETKKFFETFDNLCPHLASRAREVPKFYMEEEMPNKNSMARYVKFLNHDVTKDDWKLIMHEYGAQSIQCGGEYDCNKVLELGLEHEIIGRDCTMLKYKLRDVGRDDLVIKVDNIWSDSKFSEMEDRKFREEFKKKLSTSSSTELWKSKLQKYTRSRHAFVDLILRGADGEEKKSLEQIYIPLTVTMINQKPDNVAQGDENTENELDLLEKFYNIKEGTKSVSNKPAHKSDESHAPKDPKEKMNIIELLLSKKLIEIPDEDKKYRNYSNKNISWCIIGNPGSGKTFLCSRIALLYGHSKLSEYEYCLAIPCRKLEWHELEKERDGERERKVSNKFILQWLKLGMPSEKWTDDLAKYILSEDGDGVLLIIDSMDEFTKDFLDEHTILAAILRRDFLTKSTIILTSRPGAWTHISSKVTEIDIKFYFHVLGFSPENRNQFFENMLEDPAKFKDCEKLFECHHEINLLSLIPVNASYFATLFKSEDATSYTLTRLYSSLILYLIKRHLSRVRLLEYTSEVYKLQDLNQGILDCLNEIGEVAYEGVENRKLTSSEMFKLKIGARERDSECLGLVNVSVKEKSDEKHIVWSFSHLTLQEFVASYWLSNKQSRDTYLITRFVVSTTETFSKFKMILRFLCGLLMESALLEASVIEILGIIYKHQLPLPLPYNKMPFFHQYRYESIFEDSLFHSSGSQRFTNQFISISSFLVETKLEKDVPNFPKDISLYIQTNITPNEWFSFLKLVSFLKSIHLIYIDSNFLSLEDFKSLLLKLVEGKCPVGCITIKFNTKPYSHIRDYFYTISCSEISTKLSIDLDTCTLTSKDISSGLKTLSNEQHPISSIYSSSNVISNKSPHFMEERLSSLENLYLRPRDTAREFSTLLPDILKLTNLIGLHLFGIPDNKMPMLSGLSTLTQLEEISCYSSRAYSILPHLTSHTRLTYFDINGGAPREISKYYGHLLKLLDNNKSSLKTLVLYRLENIGAINLNSIFESVHNLDNLARFKLEYSTQLTFFIQYRENDEKDRRDKLEKLAIPRSLVCLELWRIPLGDRGLGILVNAIKFHHELRYLLLSYCELTSNSCGPLNHLLSVLRNMKTLVVYQSELTKPDEKPYKQLILTANKYSIQLKTSD